MTIALGSDHAGFELKLAVASWLSEQGHQVESYGAESTDRYDYPEASNQVAQAVLDQKADFGILICGTGIGVSIRANRYPGIRAALCTNKEMASLAREHNDANVLCLGARILEEENALEIVRTFLASTVDSNERHQKRVALLDAPLTCQE